jgi:hypothetical protein
LSTAESTAHVAASESAAATTASESAAATMTATTTTATMTAATAAAMFGGQGVRHPCCTKRDGDEEDHDLACDGPLLGAGR